MNPSLPPTLSICIPTLNRCDFLCAAVKSIFDAGWDPGRVEVCISNNASEHDYSALTQLLASAPQGLRVRYCVQPKRLPVDEHMLAVRCMANADHIYFLGDDDRFLDGQLPQLLALIDRESPDLAIFNGVLIDAAEAVIGRHFTLPPRTYPDVVTAFRDLRNKGMFGAVLVKAEHLQEHHFRALFGSSHAYGCYWFSLLEAHVEQRPAKIMIPYFPLVGLRMAAKTYSALDVYYRQIPYEIAVYRRYLPAGVPQQVNLQFEQDYDRMISSFSFLSQMRFAGMPIRQIEGISPRIYRRHAWKVRAADFLVSSGAYEHLRRIYRTLRGHREIRS
jgi:glycosyltransferase involved in cell wall biosynthesis